MFRLGHSSPMRKGRMVTDTQELLKSLGGRGLLGPIFASPSLSSEPARYRKGSSLTDPAPQLCVLRGASLSSLVLGTNWLGF